MTRNQLPEGVGKKIVEALKRQAQADITPLDESSSVISNSLPLTDIDDVPEIQYEPIEEETAVLKEDLIVEEVAEEPKKPVIQESVPVVKPAVSPAPISVQPQPQPQPHPVSAAVKKEKSPKFNSTLQAKIPANVAVLKNLINTLPAGVSKQTGAQIIRQTLEAMGLPMNTVLKEAQDVQEELNNSTRECMLKIQEYKTNILQLEQSVQEYQRDITQINELVSLFLLTDKEI